MPEDALWRLPIFIGLLVLMLALEAAFPKREAALARRDRWPANVGVQLINTLVLRLLFPAAAVGIALWAEQRHWGVFADSSWPALLVYFICLLVLDLAVFGQHVLSHHWPWLWRLHRMHHSDVHLDVTTALRFHPAEILVSMLWKGLVVTLLGAPPVAVLWYEVMLSACALFNHANWAIAPTFDRWLRCVVVTPDMHRIHHSVLVHETNSNYGNSIVLWDRLVGSYRAQPEAGHRGMSIGLQQFRGKLDSRLGAILLQPFRR